MTRPRGDQAVNELAAGGSGTAEPEMTDDLLDRRSRAGLLSIARDLGLEPPNSAPRLFLLAAIRAKQAANAIIAALPPGPATVGGTATETPQATADGQHAGSMAPDTS